MPFEDDELSIVNIRKPFMKHFRLEIQKLKNFDPRFIKPEGEVVSDKEGSLQCNHKMSNHRDKIYAQPHILCMHAGISYYFTQILYMNRVETCVHDNCMGLYGNLTITSPICFLNLQNLGFSVMCSRLSRHFTF